MTAFCSSRRYVDVRELPRLAEAREVYGLLCIWCWNPEKGDTHKFLIKYNRAGQLAVAQNSNSSMTYLYSYRQISSLRTTSFRSGWSFNMETPHASGVEGRSRSLSRSAEARGQFDQGRSFEWLKLEASAGGHRKRLSMGSIHKSRVFDWWSAQVVRTINMEDQFDDFAVIWLTKRLWLECSQKRIRKTICRFNGYISITLFCHWQWHHVFS